MRVIKFRARCDDKMYKVDTLGFDEGGIRESMSFAHKERNEFIIEAEDGTRCIMFRNAIFMQYTGIKDIYEGDICENGVCKYEVIFKNGAFRGKALDCEYPDDFNFTELYSIAGLEVIGNIYEEPK